VNQFRIKARPTGSATTGTAAHELSAVEFADTADPDQAVPKTTASPLDNDSVARTLRQATPYYSAYRRQLSPTQWLVVTMVAGPTAFGILVDPLLTAKVWVGVTTVLYIALILFRLNVVRHGWKEDAAIDPPLDQIVHIPTDRLPCYTVLVPLFREKRQTVSELLLSLAELEYPAEKLDGFLLVEDDDRETRSALNGLALPSWLSILLIPPGAPRTKPKALLHGLRAARGSYLTVYDAEDKPDRLQLKKASWVFMNAGPSVACLQAKLGYYNGRQNLLTRWFNLEYDDWFSLFLPGLHDLNAPIPLGGTSNHFDIDVLHRSLAWDPYNVTEDADLGLRLARLGRTTVMLESTTREEANSKLANWIRQRSRWMKGYLQTVIVHTRHPTVLYRDLGPGKFASFLAVFVGGPFVALVSPIFWVMLALWVIAQPSWIAALFSGWIYYASMTSFVLGTFALVFAALLAAVRRGDDDLASYSLLLPVYWLLISVAAYVALIELILRPHHWHKTEHGLHIMESRQ